MNNLVVVQPKDARGVADCPAWLLSVVQELLNCLEVSYPLGWEVSECEDGEHEDRRMYEIHVWPAAGLDSDGDTVWEDVTYGLNGLMRMFKKVEVYGTSVGVLARSAAEARTSDRVIVWALHFEPPENAVPNHRRLDDGGWEYLVSAPKSADVSLN